MALPTGTQLCKQWGQGGLICSWPRGTWLLVAVLTTLPGLEIYPSLISFHSIPTLAFDVTSLGS